MGPIIGFALMVGAGFYLDFSTGHWILFVGYILWTGGDMQRSG